MSTNPEDADRKKITIYGCPSPGCEFTTGGIPEIEDHINSEHEGEWNKGFWPEPQEDADDE